ncbi:PAS and ANTAR domain-containing protein [soil metagenome]
MLEESTYEPQVTNGSEFTDASEPSTDGGSVRPIDKALLGGAPQSVGRFEYHYGTDTWAWSDTVARIHGYQPGEVEPTTELILRHKHPDDLAQVKGLEQAGAPFSSKHRILTTTGEERNVVVVGNVVTDDDGKVTATRGFYIDITESLNAELQQALSDELETVLANREVIEQAKGMLMAVYALTADAAFGILRWRSQESNVKLWNIAAQLVADLPGLLNINPTARSPIDHYLLTLVKPDDD